MANFFTDCKNTKDYLTSEDNSRNCDDLKTDGTCKDNKWADTNTLENDKIIGFPTQNCCACGKGTDNNPKCVDTKDWEFKEKVTDGATPSPTKYNCQYLADKGICKDRYFDRGKEAELIKLAEKTTVTLKDIQENCCVCGKVDRFGDPAINEEGCPFDYPFRTRFKEHKEDGYKYCYKKKECLSKIDRCTTFPMRKEAQVPYDIKRTGKRFPWPPLNDENCHEDTPYRTRLKIHEKDGFKICYEEKDCATGKKKEGCPVLGKNEWWPDKPKIWPPLSKKYKPKSKKSQGFMAKMKSKMGGGSNSILFMLILIISLYLVIKMNKKK